MDKPRFVYVTYISTTPEKLWNSPMLAGITEGWPKVLSSLKSLLEAGKPLPRLW